MSAEFILAPAVIALSLGTALSAVLVVPLIARQYQMWGTLSLTRLFLILAFMVYLIAIPMYTLLPIGIDVAELCARGEGRIMQFRPFAFVGHVREVWDTATNLREFIRSGVVQEAVLNIIFFVPLGIFLRQLNRWPVWMVISAAFGTSMLVELTQLTGNWGAAECPYRVFSVDDLILNTGGAIVGIAIAPLLSLFPGVRLDVEERTRVRPVTRARRAVQIFCDWLTFTLLSTVAGILAMVVTAILTDDNLASPSSATAAMADIAVGVLLFVGVPLATRGETLGERIVLIEVRTPAGASPTALQILLKALGGWLPYATLVALATDGVGWAWAANLIWVGFQAVYALRSPGGFSTRLSGLRRFDRRAASVGADSHERTRE